MSRDEQPRLTVGEFAKPPKCTDGNNPDGFPINPCPFCGISQNDTVDGVRAFDVQGKVFSTQRPHSYRVHCNRCCGFGPEKRTAKDAIDFWNGERKNDRK